MNLVFCIKTMDNSSGGAERVLADVASGLVERGHGVSVLSFDQPGGTSYYELASGIDRITLGIGNTRSRATLGETIERIRALRSTVPTLRPDVVVGFMHSMFLPLGLALVGRSVPLVASEHIVPAHYRNRPGEAVLLGLTPLIARSITVVSEQVLQVYPAWLRGRMRVVHNPVSIRGGDSWANVIGNATGRRTLLTVGRLAAQKDHASLINAFSRIAEEVPNWDLRIVGEGELRPQLEAQVARLGLEDRVALAGSRLDVAAEYAAAQLFVLPSRYESLGLTAAEAIAHGLPVVGFADCAGVNELVRPSANGLLVEPGPDRVGALGAALRGLMIDAGRRQRLAPGAEALPDELRLERVLDRWEEVLREAAEI